MIPVLSFKSASSTDLASVPGVASRHPTQWLPECSCAPRARCRKALLEKSEKCIFQQAGWEKQPEFEVPLT